MKKFNKGISLPLVMFLVLVLSVTAVPLVKRFSGIGKKEYTQRKIATKYYGHTQAGIERAQYHMQYGNYNWSSGQSQTFTINIDGQDVVVTIDDYVEP